MPAATAVYSTRGINISLAANQRCLSSLVWLISALLAHRNLESSNSPWDRKRDLKQSSQVQVTTAHTDLQRWRTGRHVGSVLIDAYFFPLQQTAGLSPPYYSKRTWAYFKFSWRSLPQHALPLGCVPKEIKPSDRVVNSMSGWSEVD